MTSAIPQAAALRLWLAAIAGNEPTASYFEIRAKRIVGAGMAQDFIPVRDLDRAAKSVINRGQITDTYVGVAPRAERRGTAAAIENVWCLWADCDDPESLKRAACSRQLPLPSIVVRSGSDGHAHAYWPLNSPIPPAWAKRGNQRLALKLGADRAATDAARILRPPGTLNHKHEPPRPIICTRLEIDVFTIDQVVGHLPDDRAYIPPARQPRPARRPAKPTALLDGLARTVRTAAVGNRNAALYWAACRVSEHNLDAGDAREVLRDAALAAGLCEHEADRTISSALQTRVAA